MRTLSGIAPSFQASTFEMSDPLLLSSSSTQDSRYWSKQGETLLNLTQYLNALTCFERSLALHPEDPEVLVFQGVTLIHLQRYEEALAALDRALQLSPRHAEALIFRGAALNYLGRYSECYKSYHQALHSHRPRNSETASQIDRFGQFAANLFTRLMSPHTP